MANPSSNLRLWNPGQGIIFASQSPPPPQRPASNQRLPQAGAVRRVHAAVEAISLRTTDSSPASHAARSSPNPGPPARSRTAVERPKRPAVTPVTPRAASEPASAVLISPASASDPPRVKTADSQEEEETAAREARERSLQVEPPTTDLPFRMCSSSFHEARLAAAGTPESFWSYALYRGPYAAPSASNEEMAKEDDSEGRKLDRDSEPRQEEEEQHSTNGRREEAAEAETPLEKVKVHYCRSKHTMERVLQYFLDEPVLGLDLEWQPEASKWHGARKNVSLIQLASPSRIALFHVALFPRPKNVSSHTSSKSSTTDNNKNNNSEAASRNGATSSSKNDELNEDLVTPTFRAIMANPKVNKVGVAIKADCTRMKNFLDVDTRGIFELSHLHNLVKYSRSGQVELVNKRLVPLAGLVEEHLRLPMFKGPDVRSSNWALPLKMEQIIYAASDAFAGVQLYHILESLRLELDPVPPRPYHAERGLPIRLAHGVSVATADDDTVDAQAWGQSGNDETPTKLTPSFIASMQDTIQIESDGQSPSRKPTTPSSRPSTKPTPSGQRNSKWSAKKAPSPSAPKDSRITAAEAWLDSYKATRTQIRAPLYQIRAYKIWHTNTEMTAEDVAKLLRNPPLQTGTVVGYILEAVRIENLPFDHVRMKAVLEHLPEKVRASRYAAISRLLQRSSGSQAMESSAASPSQESKDGSQ